jgi:hypothetical protein
MKDYKELVDRLREYSYSRKGEIAKLTHDAAIAIDVLMARVKILEQEVDDGK